MKDVTLEEFIYPCVYYCIKRTGANMVPTEVLALPRNKFDQWDKRREGDIIIWHSFSKNSWKEMTVSLRSSLGVITTRFKDSFHFGVYEGGGFVSDLTTVKNVPTLRITPVEDWILPKEFIRKELLVF